MRRRTFLKRTAVTSLGMAAAQRVTSAQTPARSQAGPVSVQWLGETPPLAETGVSWGVPWPRGAFRKDQKFTMMDASGKALPLETWPLAYWPDGSLKWSGLATVAGAGAAGPFRLAPGTPPSGGPTVSVRETATTIEVDAGKV